MNILVIGNGFDLAHGLPTKYDDFLKWVEVIEKVWTEEEPPTTAEQSGLKEQIFAFIKENMGNVQGDLFEQQEELSALIKDNFWLEYFEKNKNVLKQQGKEGWIDFESVISEVIQSLENDCQDFDSPGTYQLTNPYLNNKFLDEPFERGENNYKTFREIRDDLYNDLNKLIRLFEIYVCDYVEKMDIKVKSPDIEKCYVELSERGTLLANVISFNYTHTFKNVYCEHNDINFIHGEANRANTLESNNMVLGIDEYLCDGEKDKNVEFVGFKKYFQRIYKNTGSEYKTWIDEINMDDYIYNAELAEIHEQIEHPSTYSSRSRTGRNSNVEDIKTLQEKKIKHHVFFFGHSLDITDKDVIRDLILHDTVHTTIYYYAKNKDDKQDLFTKISNLVKIIGQDELIKRTGGETKTIEFVPQRDMVQRA